MIDSVTGMIAAGISTGIGAKSQQKIVTMIIVAHIVGDGIMGSIIAERDYEIVVKPLTGKVVVMVVMMGENTEVTTITIVKAEHRVAEWLWQTKYSIIYV